MQEKVRQDILAILRNAKELLKQNDIPGLAELSNHTIHCASVFQDEDSIMIAVVIFSLSKIIARNKLRPLKGWDAVLKKVLKLIEKARTHLESFEFSKYRQTIKLLLRRVGNVDKRLKLYIDDVIRKAKITKGTKLYEHGISIERAAQLMGISQWELMAYLGKTKIIDAYDEKVLPVSKRLNYAKKIFGIK